MNLTITRLGPQDVARAHANCALFRDMANASEQLTQFLADPDSILVVAEIDGLPVGQIIGYLLNRWDAKKPMLFAYSIDVLESCRRRGIARRLMKQFFQIGNEAGCGKSFLFTSESNTPAMKLYQAMGGIRLGADDVMFLWKDENY
jgi:ribosomal protein S18 acetylase RimI-like enzyme